MLHIIWSSIDVVPCWFSRSSIKFKGHMREKITDFHRNLTFPELTPVWIDWMLWNDAQDLKQHRRGAVLFFKVIHQISRSHETKKSPILTKIGCFQFEFTNGYEMLHKAWSHIELVYCFTRSSIKFQGRTGQKVSNFDLNLVFLDCNDSFNSLMALK